MGALTLADFKSEILAGLGNRGDLSDSRIVSHLNLAQSRLCRAYDFLELQELTYQLVSFTSTPSVDKIQNLPPLTKTVHSIVLLDDIGGSSSLANSRKMVEKPWRWFDRKFPVPEFDAPGWPSIYTRWGNKITVWPPPQAAFHFNIRSTNWPTPFVVGTTAQTSDFDNKDDILIDLALSRIFRSLGAPGRGQAEEHLQSAIEATKEAITRENTRPDMDTSRDISDMPTIGSGTYWVDPFIRAIANASW